MKRITIVAVICSVLPFIGKGQSGLNLTLSGYDAKCNGSNSGSASVNVTGGAFPYTYNWSPSGGTTNSATGLTAGSYTVTVKDSKGITANGTISINQPPPLNVVLDSIVVKPCFLLVGPGGGGGSCGCNNTIWAVASGGTPPYTYAWNDGKTSDTIHQACYVTFKVTVTDSNQCQVRDSLYLAIPVIQGINELQAPSDVKLYPVPADNILNVSINQLAADTRKIEVYDMMGKQVIEQELKENTTSVELNVSAIPNGTYLLRIIGDYSQHAARFTVSR